MFARNAGVVQDIGEREKGKGNNRCVIPTSQGKLCDMRCDIRTVRFESDSVVRSGKKKRVQSAEIHTS